MAQSRNMADSGLDVIVGLEKVVTLETAIEHDMPVMTVEAASRSGCYPYTHS
jgi:ketol-acid reductoisomerase